MRLKGLLVFLLAYVGIALGQSTNVTGTLVDSQGTLWTNAVVTCTFYPTPGRPGPFIWSGGTLNTTPNPVTTNSSGVFTISLPDNTTISPAGSQWSCSVSPNASMQAVVVLTPVTGATYDISALFTQDSIPAPAVAALYVPRAYGTEEVTPNPPVSMGALIFNTASLAFQYWDGTTWQNIGAGGAGNPAGPGNCVQFSNTGVTAFACDTQAGFGSNSVFGYNPTTHDLALKGLNGLAFASQYQTGSGGNGVANFLGSTPGQLVVVTPDDAGDADALYATTTPDNSVIYDMRAPGGEDANLNPIGPNIQFKNCQTVQPFYQEALLATPECGAYSSYYSNGDTENNVDGGFPLVVNSNRDGPCVNQGFDSIGLPWCITGGMGVNVAKYANGIVDGLTVNISTLGPGDINGIAFGFETAGGQGSVANDQGVTAVAVNGSQEVLNTYSVVQSTTGTGDRQPIPAPFPGTMFYNRFAAGVTFQILDLQSPVVGNTGTVNGAFVQNGQQGNGMTAGNYTVSCTGGGGSGASISVTVVNGQVNPVTGITGVTHGSGYTHGPACASWSPAPGGSLAILKPLLDLEGTMTALGTFVDSTYLPVLTVAGMTLTPSTGSVVTTSAAPSTTIPGTQQTDVITVNIKRSLPVQSGFAWSADPAFPQPINIISVTTTGSTQSITVQHIDPIQVGSNILQGGTEGCLQEDANWAFSNNIQCDWVFGASDSTHAAIYHISHSGPTTNFPNGVAKLTAPQNKIRIMSAANPIYTEQAVPGFGGSQSGLPTLNWNAVHWQDGDDYVQPMNTNFDISAVYAANVISQAPSDNGDSMGLFEFGGMHFDANTTAWRLINLNDPAIYAVNGGQLSEPGGYQLQGQFQYGLFLTAPPSNCVICVTDDGDKTVLYSGSTNITEDPPNQLWNFANYGILANGAGQFGALLFGGVPGIALNQMQLSVGGGVFNSEYADLGVGPLATLGDTSGTLGLEEADAGVLRAGLQESVIFIAAGPVTVGTTTYTYVATSQNALGGETLPGTPQVDTLGPATTSSSNFFQINGALAAGAQFVNIYRRTGFGGVGRICQLDTHDLSLFGCKDTGQTATVAEPTVDTSGTLIVAHDATITGKTTSSLGVGPTTNTLWTSGSGAPSGSCTNGALYTSTTGTSTNILWACGSTAWQLVK